MLERRQLQRPNRLSFDTRPAAVDGWIDGLPMADIGKTTRLVYDALRQVNTLDIPLKQRFHFLEAVAVPLAAILPALFRDFCNASLPMAERSRRIAALSNALHIQMLIGHSLALESEGGGIWLSRKAHHRMWSVSVHHFVRYFLGLQENCQLLDSALPKGTWQQLHLLYAKAANAGWTQEAVPWPGGDGRASSLEHEYKRVLLLAFLPVAQMNRSQLFEAWRSMDEWCEAVELTTDIGQVKGLAAPLCVRLDLDAPPFVVTAAGPIDGATPVNTRLLNSVKLQSRLRKYLDLARGGVLPKARLQGGQSIARETLEILHRAWCEPRTRRERRLADNRKLHVVAGLEGAHRFVSGREGAATRGAAFQMQLERNESMAVRYDTVDVWDRAYNRPAVERNVGPRISPVRPHLLVEAQVVDFSERGYRLRSTTTLSDHFRQGELVALREEGADEWRIGHVRWVEAAGEGVLLGVQVVQDSVLAVSMTITAGEKRSAPLACFVSLDEAFMPLLLVTALPGFQDKQLAIISDGHATGIRLRERTAVVGSFELYRFTVKGWPMNLSEDVAACRGRAAEALRKRLSGMLEWRLDSPKGEAEGAWTLL